MNSLEERFWSKVDRRGPDDCWHWTAGVDLRGYGRFFFDHRNAVAHRVAFMLASGSADLLPADQLVDHMCHNADGGCLGGTGCPHRRCVNPAHLRVATFIENVQAGRGGGIHNLQKTHCPQGHPYIPGNLDKSMLPWRRCLTCKMEGVRVYQRKRRARERAAREARG